MMKKKKFKLLWPSSNCCLKKFLDLEVISKYGSIFILVIMILSQIFNIIMKEGSYNLAFLSMIINTFFLIIVLIKVEILKFYIKEKYLTNILKFMILVFIINSFGYLASNSEIHNYVFAPISFFGAYFIFLLILNK